MNNIKSVKKSFAGKVGALAFSAILIAGGNYLADYCYFDQQKIVIAAKASEVARLKLQNDEAERVARNAEKLESEVEEAESAYRALEPLVPSQAELSQVLVDIEREANDRNLKLQLFTQAPQPAAQTGGALAEVPLQIEIRGDYGGISRYIQALNRLRRILLVKEVHFFQEQQQISGQLTARASISCSAFVGEKLRLSAGPVKVAKN